MRYRIPGQTHIVTKSGRSALFTPDRIGADGLAGYTDKELESMLTKDQIVLFFVPLPGVEQATASPGEKRSVKKPAAKK